MKRTVDRFLGGLSIEQSVENQGVEFVPMDSDMAMLSEQIRRAIYEGDDSPKVLGAKAASTQGRYGAPERSLDFEVVAREGFDVSSLRSAVMNSAREANQDSAFVARVLREEEEIDLLKHRPGVEIYFRSQQKGEAFEEIAERLNQHLDSYGLFGFTVIVSPVKNPETSSGAMPPAVGVRLISLPEFAVRYGDESWVGLTDDELTAKMGEEKVRLHDMARGLTAAFPEVNFAQTFHYEADVRFRHEYPSGDTSQEGRGLEGSDRPVGGTPWTGRLLRDAIEAAGIRSTEEVGNVEPLGLSRESDAVQRGNERAGTSFSVIKSEPKKDRIARYDAIQGEVKKKSPAVKLKTGHLFTFSELHVQFLTKNRIHPDDVESGGWTDSEGIYNASFRSDTARWVQMASARARLGRDPFKLPGDVGFSVISNAQDAEYLNLAKDPEPNREKLQAMVDDAAEDDGATIYFRGDSTNSMPGNGVGIFLTPLLQEAREYARGRYAEIGGETRVSRMAVDSDLNVVDIGVARDLWGESTGGESFNMRGEKGVELREFLEAKGFLAMKDGKHLIIFNPNQIKSADPVTYDESGNVIPLSERFNPEKDSISYSVISNAESRIAAMFSPYLRDPEMRFKIVQEAQARTAVTARAWQQTISNYRSVANLNREEATREGEPPPTPGLRREGSRGVEKGNY